MNKWDYLKDGEWKACQNGTYQHFTKPEKASLVLTCLEKMAIGLISIIAALTLTGII